MISIKARPLIFFANETRCTFVICCDGVSSLFYDVLLMNFSARVGPWKKEGGAIAAPKPAKRVTYNKATGKTYKTISAC